MLRTRGKVIAQALGTQISQLAISSSKASQQSVLTPHHLQLLKHQVLGSSLYGIILPLG